MKKAMLGMILLAGSVMAAPAISFGIGFGAPAPVAVVRPACPGPGYAWVDGYYAPSGVWVTGYWRAPVVEPHYVAPRHFDDRGRFDDHARVDRARDDHGRDFRR